jgi:hypothetical protein
MTPDDELERVTELERRAVALAGELLVTLTELDATKDIGGRLRLIDTPARLVPEVLMGRIAHRLYPNLPLADIERAVTSPKELENAEGQGPSDAHDPTRERP